MENKPKGNKMKLTSRNVESVFMDCLFKDGEDTTNHLKSEGITNSVGFHPERVDAHKSEIFEMLLSLPKEFHEKTGGGMSFLNACNDKRGEQWTGEHRIMEQLFLLGQASGKVECLMPREMWSVLPGGMPYYVVSSK